MQTAELRMSMTKWVEKIVIGIAAAIMVVMALVWVTRLFNGLESATRLFGMMEGFTPAVGTLVFVLFGLAPALVAAAAAIPIIRGLIEDGYHRNNIERSIVSGVMFIVLCIAYYIGKLTLGSSMTGDFGSIAGTLALAYGQTAVDTLVPMIVATVALVIVRAKLVQGR